MVPRRNLIPRLTNSGSGCSPPPTAPTAPTPTAPATPLRISGGRSRGQKGTRYADHAEGISSNVAQRPDDNQCHHGQDANYALGRRAQDNSLVSELIDDKY